MRSHIRARASAVVSSGTRRPATSREHEQHAPLADGAHPEQDDGLADARDALAARERGGVDQAQQAEGQPDVGHDRPLELVDVQLGRVEGRGELQVARGGLGEGLGVDGARAAVEPALEEVEARLEAGGVRLGALDADGQQLALEAGQRPDRRLRTARQRRRRTRVHAGDAGEREHFAGLDAAGQPGDEVSDGDAVARPAQSAQPVEQRAVDGLAVHQVEHDALGAEGQRVEVEQEARGDGEERRRAARRLAQPDLGHGAEGDPGRGGVGAGARAAVQQGVAREGVAGVEDGLAREGDRQGRLAGGARAHPPIVGAARGPPQPGLRVLDGCPRARIGPRSGAELRAHRVELGEERQVQGPAQEVDAGGAAGAASCGRWCAARPGGGGSATAGSCPRRRRAPRRSRRRPSAARGGVDVGEASSPGRGRSTYGLRPVAVEAARPVRRTRGGAGRRRNSSYRLGALEQPRRSCAWAAGSWAKTCTMSAFLLPSRNSTCAVLRPTGTRRGGRGRAGSAAYSDGVSVASTDHWSVTVCWMCLTRAIRLRAGARSSAREQRHGPSAARGLSSFSHSSVVWCWTMNSSSSWWPDAGAARRAAGRAAGSRRRTGP